MVLALDVAQHGLGRAPAAVAAAQRFARTARPAGLTWARALATTHLQPTLLPVPVTPGRTALLTAWADRAALDHAELPAVLRESERVRLLLEPGGTTGIPWCGLLPRPERPLADDEPALTIIQGTLRPRHVPAFARANARVVAQAQRHPAFLGGIGLQDTPLAAISCSAWRSLAGARDFAWTAGGAHGPAVRTARAVPWHRAGGDGLFVRFRLLDVEGTPAARGWFGL